MQKRGIGMSFHCVHYQSREGHLISYDEIISCHIHAASKLRDAKRC